MPLALLAPLVPKAATSSIKKERQDGVFWSRVSALPRRPAAYKAAALLTELTRHTLYIITTSRLGQVDILAFMYYNSKIFVL